MKTKFQITVVFLILFTGIKCEAQVFKTAVEYLSFLGTQSTKVSEDMWDYTRTIAKAKGAKKIELRRKDLVNQLNLSMKTVRSRPAFNRQEYLKVAYVNYYQTNINVLNEDYKKMMDMEEIAEKSYDEMEKYILIQEKASAKMEEASTLLYGEVQKYAFENKITLTDDQTKTAKKLKKANEAFGYYQPIYLILFKAMVQENNFLAALNANKITEAEQAKSALSTYANEGLTALATKESYNNDKKLIEGCSKLLSFYKGESEKMIPEMLSFKVKESNFQKLNSTFSKKKKTELTQEEINEFNTAVTEMNASLKPMNALLEKGNKERSKEINEWNEKVENFLKKHAA